MIYNKRVITYDIVSPKESFIEINGDYQKFALDKENSIGIMPAYFRLYKNQQNPLVVTISIDKKYSFRNFGKVVSKEFGDLNLINENVSLSNNQYETFSYSTTLEQIDIVEREKRILKDTLIITMGELAFKFAPKSR